ncbi:hypothetical protein ACTXT7_002338 [Hymenolepis weldensis]
MYRKKDVKRVDKWMKFIQNIGFDSFYKGKPNEESPIILTYMRAHIASDNLTVIWA